jgi:hypothetical protein
MKFPQPVHHGFNNVAVSNVFDLLAEVIDENHLTSDKTYNADETGITINAVSPKIVEQNARRQVGDVPPLRRVGL